MGLRVAGTELHNISSVLFQHHPLIYPVVVCQVFSPNGFLMSQQQSPPHAVLHQS